MNNPGQTSQRQRSKRLLIFTDYYLPGFRAGGPIKSLQSLLSTFGDEFELVIVTRNHDLEDTTPYFDPRCNVQSRRIGKGRVIYLSRGALWSLTQLRILTRLRHDGVYLNSFFSFSFSILPCLFQHFLTKRRRTPIVLAPRGEFSIGALGLKGLKKRLYLALSSVLQIYRRVIWQASTALEKEDILRVLARWSLHTQSDHVLQAPPLIVARDLTDAGGGTFGLEHTTSSRPSRAACVVFLSRISRKKNLDGALRILSKVSVPVEFDIYGPLEDLNYWGECQQLIASLPRHVTARYKEAVPARNVQDTLAKYDVLLLPTLGENYGHVILESLLAGCPVLLSTETPWRELEKANVGWDIPLRDTQSFVEKIELLAGMTQEARLSMRSAARAFAERHTNDTAAIEQNRLVIQVATGVVDLQKFAI